MISQNQCHIPKHSIVEIEADGSRGTTFNVSNTTAMSLQSTTATQPLQSTTITPLESSNEGSSDDVIDLTSDGESEKKNNDNSSPLRHLYDNRHANVSSPTNHHCASDKKKAPAKLEAVDDDECMIVSAPDKQLKLNTTAISSSMEQQDEVELVGATGPNALEDFPHARQDCVKFPFSASSHDSGNRLYCSNCYCYVCDVPASECSEWNHHCQAKPNNFFWERQRQVAKQKKRHPPTVATATTANNFSNAFSNQLALLRNRLDARVARSPSTSRVPRRRAASRSTAPRARTAARTSRSATRSTAPRARTAARTSQRATRPQAISTRVFQAPVLEQHEEALEETIHQAGTDVAENSVQALLKQLTRTYPTEIPALPPHLFQTTLRSYQRQSVAFMQNIEQMAAPLVRGGWLASDVGMGKSAIVIALVAADKLQGIQSKGRYLGRTKVKTTVVLTSASLMGQWEDECTKHAPNLTIRRFHPTSRSRVALKGRFELPNVDILISTATFEWPESYTSTYFFHRVVMDEAHLFSNSRTANIAHAQKIQGYWKWCVTATPCTTSLSNLDPQFKFLGCNHPGCHLQRLLTAAKTNSNAQSLETFGQALSKFVIRHEKSQIMGDGSQALALPPMATKVITLQMSQQERTKYMHALNSSVASRLQQYQSSGIGTFPLERNVLHPLSSDKLFQEWKESSKISALVEDIRQLQEKDSNLRAVVFTQYKHTHQAVASALRKFFCINVVYELTGSTSTTDRDFCIRTFQGPRNFPAVIVVTLRAGSVGMTLTTASTLYLMEPSIDPAAELQAMGRIHRLGQDRNVEVKKFVFADSVEANLLDLHKAIKSGEISIQNNQVPGSAIKILSRGVPGVGEP